VVVALACILYSMAQRALSTQSRFWRRRVTSLAVGVHGLTKDDIVRPVDVALKFMTWAIVSLAAGLVIMRI
jgi:hypothetical protein